MYVRENVKKTLERVTGIQRPSTTAVRELVRNRKAHETMFADDGSIPNNPKLPFIHYRSCVRLSEDTDPAAVFEELFKLNGWGSSWRNGIYDYVHYHSNTHEALGIARGHAKVRFGGNKGKVFELEAGDVVVLPAGTGHQALSATRDLLVVGAYPGDGKYDECTGSREEHARAVRTIPAVPVPAKDPVYGARGPLMEAWGA
jgi:uncharacterized protein YjlB